MKTCVGLGLLFALITSAGAVSAVCNVHVMATLPVTMQGTQPLVEARINGAPAMFMADSGAFYSFISPGAAAQFNLHPVAAPLGIRVQGVGGSAALSVADVKDFTLAGIPVPHAQFFVGGSETGGRAQGIIGRNILSLADVEYDLAGGAIRLLRTDGCRGASLAYWAKPPRPFGVVDIEEGPPTPFPPAIEGVATVNGSRIKVVFDTGAASSLMTLSAAKRAGVGPDKPGVVFQGLSGGVGPHLVRIWVAPVDLFEIGGEKILHTRLRIGDTVLQDADMLLGADFFLSHRVYVANSQHRLYFTYNGGPVFNLAAGPAQPPPASEAPPADAAGFARRGAAEAARREIPAAVVDFGKAMELDPKQADYPYQRGEAHLVAGQSDLAMADFDRALALAPGHAGALIARANLRLAAHDRAGALADLDAAGRALATASDDRFALAALYRGAEAPARSLAEFDLWIKAHPDDRKQAVALSGRCWARTLLSSDLDKAMADCQRALRVLPSDGDALDARGFLRLRRGDLDKATTDFTAAASRAPRNAWPLYGRGLAKLRQGRAAEGKADIAAAQALDARIADKAGKYGLSP